MLLLSDFLSHFVDPAFLIEADTGRIVYCNQPAGRLLACTTADLVGTSLEDWTADETAGADCPGVRQRLFKTGGGHGAPPERFLIPFRRAKAGQVICEVSLTPGGESAPGLVAAVLRDVTQEVESRRELERQLALVHDQAYLLETERGPLLLRQLLDLAPDAVIVRDLDDRILFWNEEAARMYGWSAAEAQGADCHDLLASRFSEPAEERGRDLARAGRWQGEFRQRTKSGAVLDVLGHWSLQWSETGRPLAILEINRDITAQKATAAQLAQQTQELARSNADLEQFAYLAAHDLREPLRIVVSYLHLLERRYGGTKDPDAARLIRQAVDASGRMQTLISSLLTYARVDATEIQADPVDTLDIFRQAVGNLDRLIAETGATVKADPLPVVTADRVQLTQLLQNLLANAIKFRAERPVEVSVSAQRRAEDWVFAVRDNGVGIPAEHRERIFGLFQRAHGRGKFPGNGIGLAICKRIVERHGGRIWVESEPDRGSSFYFSLPAIERSLWHPTENPTVEAPAHRSLIGQFMVG